MRSLSLFLEGLQARNIGTTESYVNFGTIIGLDGNSKSQLWGSPIEVRRGRELENLFIERELTVLNDNEDPTFVRHRGSSFIDITAADHVAYQHIRNWKLDDDETLSEHKYLTFEIGIGYKLDNSATRIGFCTKRANWQTFTDVFKNTVTRLETELHNARGNKDIELIACKLNTGIIEACEQSMPRRRNFEKRSVPWWTAELTQLRVETNRLRRLRTIGNITLCTLTVEA